ncbi:MAG: RNA polymerase I enhancer binding protein [Icmadophila ericetorum]|nr:RNA polymerase I enhancer binding protein [Icmadophila ericetorum]
MGQASSQTYNPSLMGIEKPQNDTNSPQLKTERTRGARRKLGTPMEMNGERNVGTVDRTRKNRKRHHLENLPEPSPLHVVEPNGTNFEQGIKKHKKKKRKHSELTASEDHGDEEAESALALMKLRNNGNYEGTTRYEDGANLATAQLLRESSPFPPDEDNVFGIRSENMSSKAKSHRKKKSTKSTYKQIYDVELPDEHPEGASQVHISVPHSKTNSKHSSRLKSKQTLPHISMSLDDINSSDDEVASLLQEYETHMSPQKIPNRDEGESRENTPKQATSFLQQLYTTATNHPEPEPFRVSGGPGTRQRRKSKIQEKKLSEKFAQDEVGEEHPQPGQHASCSISEPIEGEENINCRISEPNGHISPGPVRNSADGLAQNEEATGRNSDSQGIEGEDAGLYNAEFEPADLQADSKSPLPMETIQQPPVQNAKVSARTTSQLGKKRGPYKKTREKQQKGKQKGRHPISESLPLQEGSNDLSNATNGQGHSQPSQFTTKTGRPKGRPRHAHPEISVDAVSRVSQRPARYNPTLEELAIGGGAFTQGESRAIYSYRQVYCQDHNMTFDQFTAKIHANAHNNGPLKAFWSEICEILPYRNRQSIQKFCRRQFHPYQKRGHWTREEDEQLTGAIALKGKSWIAVGQICERLPEDCRDRYRNYLVNADKRHKDQWSGEEVNSLIKAVGECIYLIKADMRSARAEKPELPDPDNEHDLEKFINWQTVSDRMGGIRSRIQCSYKWKTLKLSDQREHTRSVRTAQRAVATLHKFTSPETSSSAVPPKQPPKTNWRFERAKDHVESNLLPGDKYDILQAILRSRASSESAIPWKILGRGEEWRDRWSTYDCKAAWSIMKAEAEEAKEEEGIIGGQDTGEGFTGRVTRMSDQLVDREADALDDRWDPEETGGESAKDAKRRRSLKRKLQVREKRLDRKTDRQAWEEDPTVDPRLRELGPQVIDSSESSSDDEPMEEGEDEEQDNLDPALDEDARLEANVRLLQSA